MMKAIQSLGFALLACSFVSAAGASKSAGEMLDDSTINASVKADLIGSRETKAHQINVETYKGVVQLSGFVSSQAEKDAAARIAERVDGVREVRNSISIGADTSLSQKLDDSVTTGKVKAALIDAKDVKSGAINVETRDGVVQLSGFVPSNAMRDKAAEVASKVDGVKQLQNVLQTRHE